MPLLSELQRIPTSGARAVAPFALHGQRHLAIPQLARDDNDSPAGINGGNSDAEVLLFRDESGLLVPAGTIPAVGGEDVEVLEVDGRMLLAVASIRSGHGPYDFAVDSPIFEYRHGRFELLQSVRGYAAKQWRHFTIDGSHFLGLAQNHPAEPRESTALLRWSGRRFEPFGELESSAGYNLFAFDVDGEHFLAHADHVLPSRLYRWDGERFTEHQELLETGGGRAFLLLEEAGEKYLAVARIDGDSLILHWNGARFVEHAVLPGGAGGREFAAIATADSNYLLRVNFIQGTPSDPQQDLPSFVYRVEGGRAEIVEEFRTSGGTDIATIDGSAGPTRVAVANGLAPRSVPGATFAAETIVYAFDPSGRT